MRRIEILPGANRHKRPFWAEFIFALDSWLRWREGVFEYSHKPDCIFRAQLSRLSSDVLLSDGTFGRPGDRVIDLHLWNEQIPVTPIAGHSLAWGCRFNRSFAESLRRLARFLMSEPELSDISIIRANINLDLLHRIAARHGFEAIRDPVRLSPWERVHRFGENILYWLLTVACNSGRAWPNKFWRSRQLIYLSRRVLDCKHIVATRGHLTPGTQEGLVLMQEVRMEGLTLRVENVRRSIEFYGGKLGFTVEINKSPHFAMIRVGGPQGGTIGLLPEDKSDALSVTTPTQRAGIHIELTTDHLDALYEELKARGVEFFEPPHEEPWERSMRAHDPDGYTVEFAEGRRGHRGMT